MELIMNTDLEKSLPKQIDFNHEQLKAELSEKLKYYNALVVTEDSIKSAKDDRAKLNKLKAALDDKRKEVKKGCLTPFEDFERKVKELIGMIDQPILAIDKQIKAFDEIKKTEKRSEIEKIYQGAIGELAQLIPLEKIFNPRWMNVTYKMADIDKELSDAIFKAQNNISIIKAMNLECGQQMLDVYLRTLDMSAALAEKSRWEEQQAKIKQYESTQKKVQQEAQEQPKTIVIDGTPGHDLCDAKPGDHIVFGGNTVTAEQTSEKPEEQLKTIKLIFHDTPAAFRHEIKALTEKYGIRYGGIR